MLRKKIIGKDQRNRFYSIPFIIIRIVFQLKINALKCVQIKLNIAGELQCQNFTRISMVLT